MGIVEILQWIGIAVVGSLIVFCGTYIIFLSPQRRFKKACMVYEKIEKLRPGQMSVGEPLAQEYESRDQDKELRSVLEAGEKWPLLRGNSWTGKSHSAYEGLKRLSRGALKGSWVIRPAHEVKAEDIHLVKQFPYQRSKVVLVLDNLESYVDPGKPNRIKEIVERFRLQSQEMRVLATMRTEPKFADVAEAAQMDIAWPRFRTIDFNFPLPDMVANKEQHLEDMRKKYRSLEDISKKILWALKILRRGMVSPRDIRTKALFVEILNGEERDFEAVLKRLKNVGFAGSLRPDMTEVHDTYLERVVEDFPEKPDEIWQFLQKAAELFEKDKDSDAINQIGISFGINEKYRDARACFDAVLKLTNEKAHWAWHNKGLTFAKPGQIENKPELFNKAIECFDKALKLRNDYPEAWNNKGVALAGLKRYEEAIQCYDNAVELQRDNAEAWNNKGTALGNLGRYEEAIKCFKRALKLRKDYAKAWNNKGFAFAELEQYEQAIQYYNKALELTDSKYPEAWNHKGVAFAKVGLKDNPGLLQEALECFDKAIILREDYGEAWNNKGATLVHLGDMRQKEGLFEKAIKCLDNALKFSEFKDAQAWSNKGAALIKLDRHHDAIECLDKALILRVDFDGAWYNRASAFAGLNQKDKMLEALKEAVRLDATTKEEAQKDEDFKAYWEDEDFMAIVG